MHIFSAVNTPVTGTFTARSLLFTLHSSLFTLHSSDFEREWGVAMRPTRFPATPQPQLVQCEKVGVVDLLFVAGVANVSQHAHYSSLFTLHSSLFGF